MKSKYVLFLSVVSFFSFTAFAMQSNIEEKLFDKKISPERYLTEIQKGLYGEDLAKKMRLISAVDYSTSDRAVNLYESLVNVVRFVTGPSGAQRPSTIASFIASQIDAKYKMLLGYLDDGLLHRPSTSGSGEW